MYIYIENMKEETFSSKAAELRVTLVQWYLLFEEILGLEQTVPLTDMTATLIRNAMSKANPLSSKKYLLALCKTRHIIFWNLKNIMLD